MDNAFIDEPGLYDLFNSKCDEDISMYEQLFAEQKSVLELGIGTGRIAIPLAQLGIKVIGVDCSKKMISLLKAKIHSLPNSLGERIRIIHQDFCCLRLDEKVNYAFYPFCTFNFLLTIEQQISALKFLQPCLNQNGVVVFDLMTLNTFPQMLSNSSQIPFLTTQYEKFDVSISILNQFDQTTQVFTQFRDFVFFEGMKIAKNIRLTMKNRIIFLGEFEYLLDTCGYKIRELYGGYNFQEFDKNSESLIVLAEKK